MSRLSSAERKKLKASQFCGPDRSFPVNDCDHVIAARRMIDRYKNYHKRYCYNLYVRRNVLYFTI